MLRKGHGGLYKVPAKEERRKRKAKGRGGSDKFFYLRFEIWQVVRFRKQEEGKTLHKLHVLGMNDDLWEKVRGLGNETWKGCE